MTAVDFRCEQCGKLVSVEAEPGQEVACGHCQAVVVVPAALANLPRPQVPGGPKSATVEVPAVTDGAGSEEEAPPEEEEELAALPGAGAGAITALMPWMLSLFLHLGAGLILAFAGMMYVTSKTVDLDDIEIPGDNFVGKNAGVCRFTVGMVSTDTFREIRNGCRTSGGGCPHSTNRNYPGKSAQSQVDRG